MTTTRLPKDAIPIQDAAARYSVARRTLDRWTRAGRLRAYKLIGDTKVYVRTSVVERLLKESAAMGRPGQWRQNARTQQQQTATTTTPDP